MDHQPAFNRLLKIMDELRENCPWDQKQTIESLRMLTVEETYELSDAILKKDWQGISEELGDLLLHIVFYARIGKEKAEFDIDQIIHQLCEKLIYRHPHIYGDVKADTEQEVKQNWEKLKLKEGKKSVLGGVPASLPALPKAYRIQEKARQVGFEWETAEQVWEKVKEEESEWMEAIRSGNREDMEDELGDFLFSIVNYARFQNLDPEAALERTNMKFIKRFQFIEEKAQLLHKDLMSMTLAEMDKLWNEAKKKV